MAINNPLVPGDPFSYDLKWLVAKLKEVNGNIQALADQLETSIEDLMARIEEVNTSVLNVTINYMDELYLEKGGVFGNCDDDQKLKNTQALAYLVDNFNAISFRSFRSIQAKNFTAELNSYAYINNLSLNVFYDVAVESVFSVAGGVSYIDIGTLFLVNGDNNVHCKMGIKMADPNDRSVHSESMTVGKILFSHFDYPMILYGWANTFDWIMCYDCSHSIGIFGTSTSINEFYNNQCGAGMIAGGYFYIDGTYYNEYLYYSSIKQYHCDSSAAMAYLLRLSNTRQFKIDVLAYETADNVLVDVIQSYNGTSDHRANIHISDLKDAGLPSGKFYHDMTGSDVTTIVIDYAFGEYLYNAMSRSDYFIGYKFTPNQFLGHHHNSMAASVFNIVPTKGQSRRLETNLTGTVINYGGGGNSNLLKTYNVITGLLNKTETLKYELHPDTSSDSYVFVGKLLLSAATPYMASGDNYIKEVLIKFISNSYVPGNDYSSALYVSDTTTNVTISVNSSGTYPVIEFACPEYGTNPRAFLYRLETFGGNLSNIALE